MNDTELEQLARTLGNRAVDSLDPERIAEATRRRLAAEPAPGPVIWRRPRYWATVLAAAAAVLLVLRLTLPGPTTQPSTAEGAPAVPFLTELDALSPAELEFVLETLPPATESTVHPEAAVYEELDIKSLELLLRSLEG